MAREFSLRPADALAGAIRDLDRRTKERASFLARRYPRIGTLATFLVEHRLGVLCSIAAIQAIAYSLQREPIFDAYLFADAGADLLSGDPNVFADATIQAGPLAIIPHGALRLLGRISHIGFPLLFSLALYVGLTATVVVLLRVLLRDQARSISPSLEIYAGIMVIFAGLAGMPYAAGQAPESFVPVLWVLAAREAMRSRPERAGLLLGAAGGLKLWGLAGLPILLLAPELKRVWRGAAVMGGVTLLVYGPFLAFTDVNTFAFRWWVADYSLMSRLFAAGTPFTWEMRLLQGVLIAAGGAATAFLLRGRPPAVWALPLALIALRLLTDPIQFEYYWVPVGTIALFGSSLITSQVSGPIKVPAMGALYLLLYPAFLDGGMFFSGWVMAAAVLLGYFSKQVKARPGPT